MRRHQHLITGTALSILLVGFVACEPEVRDEPDPLAEPTAEVADEPVPPVTEEPAVALRDEGPDRHLVYEPGDIEWRDAPPSLESGAEVAVLEGDPGEAGVFTMRLRMPDGFHISPHWHPNVERVTVISGTFLLGSGEELDREAATPLGAGSYTSIPPETVHYAMAEGETVVQLSTVGPWELNYVNPEDDPRLRD